MGKVMGKKPRDSTHTPGLIPCCDSLDGELPCSDDRKRWGFESDLLVPVSVIGTVTDHRQPDHLSRLTGFVCHGGQATRKGTSDGFGLSA